MKRCAKCQRRRSAILFNASNAAPDGKQRWCRLCQSEARKQRYRKHRDEEIASTLQHRSPSQHRQYMRTYYEQHADSSRAYARTRYRQLKNCPLFQHSNRARVARWRHDNPDKHKVQRYNGKVRRRLRETNAFVEEVDRDLIYARDNGICHLCGKKAMPWNWHLDHVIPLAKGGKHEKKNCKVACPVCNLKKGAKVPA